MKVYLILFANIYFFALEKGSHEKLIQIIILVVIYICGCPKPKLSISRNAQKLFEHFAEFGFCLSIFDHFGK